MPKKPLAALAAALAAPAAATAALAASLVALYRKDIATQREMKRPFAAYDAVLPKGKEKLSFLLFYWGSRGDLQPLAVLARHLKREGHSVLINVRERYFQACLQLGLEEGDLYLQEQDDQPEDMLARQLREKPGPFGIYAFFEHIAARNEPYVQQIEEMLARSNADVLVVNEFALTPMQLMAEKHGKPLFVFRYTPLLTPTTALFCSIFGEGDHGSFLNWASYLPAIFIKAYAERSSVPRLRAAHGLRPRSALSHSLGRHVLQFPSIVGYSTQIIPFPKDLPPWYFNTGPLLPPAQEDTEQVPPELNAFLRSEPEGPIVYIGFGSFSLAQFLPPGRAAEVAQAMLGALEDLGVRAVLLLHTFDFMLDDPILSNPRWYKGEHFPHSWLFPRVSVIVHQGGAGHCAASARSGTPTLVVPIFDEQDANSNAIVSAGIARKLKIDELNRESFKAGLLSALKLAERARSVGAQVEQEVQASGEIAVQGIMRWLAGPASAG